MKLPKTPQEALLPSDVRWLQASPAPFPVHTDIRFAFLLPYLASCSTGRSSQGWSWLSCAEHVNHSRGGTERRTVFSASMFGDHNPINTEDQAKEFASEKYTDVNIP